MTNDLFRCNAVELGWLVGFYQFTLTTIGYNPENILYDDDRNLLGIIKDRFDNLLAYFDLNIDVKYPATPAEARSLIQKELDSGNLFNLTISIFDGLRIKQGSDISNLFSLGYEIERYGIVATHTEPEVRETAARLEKSIRNMVKDSEMPESVADELISQPDKLMQVSYILDCLFGSDTTKITTILVLAANPINTPPLRLDQEIRDIEEGLERAQKRDQFNLKQKLAARPKDIRRAMLDYKPNIVHFCGHGASNEGIALENDNGEVTLVSGDALSGFFELFTDTVECVVLNACFSEIQANSIVKHIPYVIGMKKEIGDADAIEFAVAFYDALGAGQSIEFAYKLACNAIQMIGMPGHLTPILKIRS